MEERKIIPDIPEYEKVSDEVVKNLNLYIEYVLQLSSRVKVIQPMLNPDFDMKTFIDKVKFSFGFGSPKYICIDGWPEKKNIAFIVFLDSSLVEGKKLYLTQHSYVFCYGDFSFGCDSNDFTHSEEHPDEFYHFTFESNFYSVGDESNTWKDTVRRMIIALEYVQSRVPDLPLKVDPPA